MFCPKCGSEIQQNAKFCGKCGAIINSTAAGNKTMTAGSSDSGQEGNKQDMAAMAQKAFSDAKKTAGGFWSEIQPKIKRWFSGYVETWQQWQKLDNKTKGIWFGVHGGVVLLLLCILTAPAVFGGKAAKTSDGQVQREESASRKKKSIKEIVKNLKEKNGVIEESDIQDFAAACSDYDDIASLDAIAQEILAQYPLDDEPFIRLMSLERLVAKECKLTSDMALVQEYQEWYDKDALMEKFFGPLGQIDYVYMSIGSDIYVITQNERVGSCAVYWYTFPRSDVITFIKETYVDSETKTERYDGTYEVSGTDITVTLDGKQYRLSEATTALAQQKEESFREMAQGDWSYSLAFRQLLDAYFGLQQFGGSNGSPAYITFIGGGISGPTIRGLGGVFLESANCSYEQGEGKTAAFVGRQSRLDFSYDKVDGNLVITVDGTSYVLEPVTDKKSDYNDFG